MTTRRKVPIGIDGDRRAWSFYDKCIFLFTDSDGRKNVPNTPDRTREEALEAIRERVAFHRSLPLHRRQAIDNQRLVPQEELGEILEHFLEYGHFRDESRHGRPIR